jgi:hypothetical protein
VGGGQQGLVVGMVHRRNHRGQLNLAAQQGFEGVGGHRAGIQVPGVRRHERHYFPLDGGRRGAFYIVVDAAGQAGGFPRIPLSGNWRWTCFRYNFHIHLLG